MRATGPSRHALIPALGLVAVLAGCSSASQSGPYSGAPVATATSKSGALSVAVRLSRQPAMAGNLDAELTITSASNSTPVDGLTLQVVPWMPQMRHGTSVTPTIVPEGSGKYLVNNLYLYMPGIWELKTAIAGSMTDSVDPQFDVE